MRNIDEAKVTNEDLRKLFDKVGKLRECRFDRNAFGQFMGSATVVYEEAKDAVKAIGIVHPD